MKLELNEIAGYLPYRLTMYAPHGFRPNSKESTGMHRVVYLTGDLYADLENNTYQGEVFKPILRPMSDLVKPEWAEFCKENDFAMNNIGEWGSDMTVGGPTHHWEFKGNYAILCELFKKHFDFQDLIGRGLAISIYDLPPIKD